MELGLGLDDDLITTRQRNTTPRPKSFNAKVCQPRWFEAEAVTDDDSVSEHNALMLKLSADLKYHEENHQDAAQLYVKSMAVLPTNSQATRLDIRQSLCRCYVKLGQLDTASSLADGLVGSAQNIDQKNQSHILKSEVAIAMKKWEEARSCFYFLIGHQPQYAHLWLQLAHLYHQEALHTGSCLDMELVTCYVRVRLLLKSVARSVCSEIKERDLLLLNEIDAILKNLGASDETISKATEFLKHDIWQDKNDLDENKDEGDNSLQHPAQKYENFNSFWFAWAKKSSD